MRRWEIITAMGASEIIKLVGESLDRNSSAQVSLYARVRLHYENTKFHNVLDVGCGDGRSFDFFRKLNDRINWTGIDIEDSPEVNRRMRTDCNFVQFNGTDIPFNDSSFDMVFSDQVFEHVRFPERLLAEIHRVLKPDGFFIGSTSQLEPYHSYSLFNYTPYGFSLILENAKFSNIKLYPSIDGLTLIWRRILGAPKFFDRWWEKDSPLNKLISLIGRLGKKDHRNINAAKLLFCGQFCFFAQK